jgi:hypothetical protein
MSTKETTVADAATAVPAKRSSPPTVVHAEPESGGSYVRNLSTGELERTSAAPADHPVQE